MNNLLPKHRDPTVPMKESKLAAEELNILRGSGRTKSIGEVFVVATP